MTHRFVRLFVLASTLTVLGCAGPAYLQAESAGHVGCAPSEVGISEAKMHWNHRSWTAICGNRVFMCSVGPSGVSSCAEVRD
jgi:hypothetical protein